MLGALIIVSGKSSRGGPHRRDRARGDEGRTRQPSDHRGRRRRSGRAGRLLVAASAGVIAEALAGYGREFFNASILLVAVVMLIWHNVWMASHGRELAGGKVKDVGEAVGPGAGDRRPPSAWSARWR